MCEQPTDTKTDTCTCSQPPVLDKLCPACDREWVELLTEHGGEG